MKTSIVITTNRSVGACADILGDTTAAMLDRLLHHSIVINLDGESYRLRDHHAAAETLSSGENWGPHPPVGTFHGHGHR